MNFRTLVLFGMLLFTLFDYAHVPSPNNDPVFVFDLGGVLFDVNTFGMAQEIGISYLISYIFHEYKIPYHIKSRVFEFMNHLGAQEPLIIPEVSTPLYIRHDGHVLPNIFCQFMAGRISASTAQEKLLSLSQQLSEQNWFTSVYEKALIERIMLLMFDAKKRTAHMYEIAEGIALVKHCKNLGYRVYILSNWDEEGKNRIGDLYHNFFDTYVDGIMISADTDILTNKPHPEIYAAFCKRYGVKPEQIYFFDDTPENVLVANNLKWHGILCNEHTLLWAHAYVDTIHMLHTLKNPSSYKPSQNVLYPEVCHL